MILQFLKTSSASLCLAAAIIIAWCLSAAALDQSVFAAQDSALLMTIGAIDGNLLAKHEWWRLLVSQFLHVHLLHMLFNAGCVLLIGGVRNFVC